jgi:two-component system, cell cycle sensor histidine kinase and response regulator CckA
MEGALIEKTNHVVALSDHELVAHLAEIIDISDDAISSSNLEGRLLSWNRGATRLYGWVAPDALTTSPTLIPSELRDFEERILQRVLRGEVVERYDSQRLRKDGSLVEVAVTVLATRDSAGRISGVAQIARDLSEQRKAEQSARLAEERLNQAQQLEAAGALADRAAHDFNNLLSIIITYSSLALEALEPDSPLRSDLMEVSQAAGRAAELTRQLWAPGRPAATARASETILLTGPGAQESASSRNSTRNCA